MLVRLIDLKTYIVSVILMIVLTACQPQETEIVPTLMLLPSFTPSNVTELSQASPSPTTVPILSRATLPPEFTATSIPSATISPTPRPTFTPRPTATRQPRATAVPTQRPIPTQQPTDIPEVCDAIGWYFSISYWITEVPKITYKAQLDYETLSTIDYPPCLATARNLIVNYSAEVLMSLQSMDMNDFPSANSHFDKAMEYYKAFSDEIDRANTSFP